MQKTVLISTTAMALVVAMPALAQQTIELWHPFNLETDMIHGGIESFNASQSDYRVEPRIIPGPQLATELVRAIATGSVPDLVTIDNPIVASFSAQGTLEDLTERVQASVVIDPDVYFEGPWNSVLWDGRIYGVPRDANTLALYYNVDMFEAAGLDPDNPPKTWSELMEAAATLTNPEARVYGINFAATQSEEGVFQWLPFLHQAGGSVDDLDSPEAAEALQFWADLVEQGYASRDVINNRQYEAANTFMAGGSAMVVGGPWELPRMESETAFEWRLTTLPVHDEKQIEASALGGYDFLIPAGADSVDGAFAFIEHMSDPQILNEGWKTGRLAPRSDVTVEDPLWPQAYEIYRTQLASARARGPHPEWPQISRPIQTAIQEALTGTKSAEDALRDAAAQIEPILERTPL